MKDEIIHFENITQFANFYEISEYEVFIRAAKDAGFALEFVEPAFKRWLERNAIPEWVNRYVKKFVFFIA